MILPPRGQSVDTNRRTEVRKALKPEIAKQRIEELMATDQVRLSLLFSDEDIHALCREMDVKFRCRDYTPAVTLGLFVAQVLSRGDTCSSVATNFNRERKDAGLQPVSCEGSAYCKARQRLPVELITTLNQRVVDIQKEKALCQWKWNSRNVYLVDGFTLRAADTEENQKVYPQPSTQKQGLGYPQVRVLAATCLATGCIVSYATAPLCGKGTGERSLFRQISSNFSSGDIVVGDSNFETFIDSALLTSQGVDVVCCINGTRKSPFVGDCKTLEDQLVTVSKPKFDSDRFTRPEWNSLPESIIYRMIRYRVSGRKKMMTIVTTLTDHKKYSSEQIADLYGYRWDVELDIRSMKSSMGMCDLKSQTPANVDREIAVGILANNLVHVLMNDAAAVALMHPREISFSQSRDAWIEYRDEMKTANDLMWMILAATSRLVADRPGREEPRKIKRRNLTKYAKLDEPRPSKANRIAAAAQTVEDS